MKDLEKVCSMLWDLLEREKIFLLEDLNFSGLCYMLGVDTARMDGYLMEELGFTGEQLLRSCRRDFKRRLKERYGIVIDG